MSGTARWVAVSLQKISFDRYADEIFKVFSLSAGLGPSRLPEAAFFIFTPRNKSNYDTFMTEAF